MIIVLTALVIDQVVLEDIPKNADITENIEDVNLTPVNFYIVTITLMKF